MTYLCSRRARSPNDWRRFKRPLLGTCCGLSVCRSRLPDFFIQGYTDFLARCTCGQARKQPSLTFTSLLIHRSSRTNFLSPSSTIHTMAINYGVVAGAVTAVYVSLRLLLHYTQDPREPRSLETLIPFVSPVIGMSRKKTNYYVMLRYSSLYCMRYEQC